MVRKRSNFIRRTDPQFAPSGQVAFADNYAFLLASTESLNAVNSKLKTPVTMHNFRPNIVVEGVGESFAEDSWSTVTINKKFFSVVRPCDRCKVPNINQVTGVQNELLPVSEALKTFRTGAFLGYKNEAWKDEVFFGQNLDHGGKAGGRISVGSSVYVTSK